MMQWAAGIAAVLLVLYLASGAALYVFQERVLFKPGPPPPPPAETEAPELSPVTLTTTDGLSLVSWYAPPAEPDTGAVVVYLHGNAGSIAGRAGKARDLLDGGLGVLLVGYRGYNGNPGRPGQAGFLADGRAALAFLDHRGFGAERRVLYGESIGSGTAVPLAIEQGAAGVVLEGAFTSIRDMARLQYPIFPTTWLLRHPFDTRATIGDLTVPLLILHGANDDLVPPAMAGALADAARAGGNTRVEVAILPEGNHVDLFDHGAGPRVVSFVRAVTGLR